MSRWFRFYGEAMRHPKVARLSDKDFRIWVALLAIASENNGLIPCLDDLVLVLRQRRDYAERALKRFCDAALLELKGDCYEPHNWSKHQYKSDTSTERVHKFREKRNVSETAIETPPDTEADTEQNITGSNEPVSHPKRVRVKYSDQFETGFWKPYPRTPIMSKAEAWKAWEKLSDSERLAANAALSGFATHCRANPNYEPVHACRFLSQRRFEGFAPIEQTNGAGRSKVFVIRGTEQWAAWLKHLGKPSMPAIERNGEYGWNFETEWPPDATIPNNPSLPDPFEARPSPRTATEREGEGHQITEARFAHAG